MEETQASSPSPQKPLSLYLIFFLVIAGFIGAFTGGYFLQDLLKTEQPAHLLDKKTAPTPKPSLQVSQPPVRESDTTLFIPGKTYFDDTLIAMSSKAPYYTIVISARRNEQENGFVQSTGFSFYDGNEWKRELATNNAPNSQIMTNHLIRNWEITIDPSRVLKESAKTTLFIANKTILVQTNELQNEIGMRSLPGYTKFMSTGKGTILIEGKKYDAHVLYTRVYSLNAKDIQFYDTPIGVQTYWLAFWDEQGNFYHVDATSVEKPTDIYQTHEIAVEKTASGDIRKSFNVDIQSDKANPPTSLTIQTNLSNQATVSLKRTTLLNKAPSNAYTWFMSHIEGEVIDTAIQPIKGRGLFEYIQD